MSATKDYDAQTYLLRASSARHELARALVDARRVAGETSELGMQIEGAMLALGQLEGQLGAAMRQAGASEPPVTAAAAVRIGREKNRTRVVAYREKKTARHTTANGGES